MFAASKTASVTGGYQISRSLRFNSADSAYLSRTPASASNQKTFTWSGWLKRGALGGYNTFFNAGNNGFVARFNNPTNYLEVYNYSGAYQLQVITAQVFRDVSAWYHIVFVVDTTPAADSSRFKLYVNGVEVTSFYGTPIYPNRNADLLVNGVNVHVIGNTNGQVAYNDGLMTEVNFIDGQALTPSSFGETNAQTGVWQPKAYSGSYGTNGFYLNFSDNSNTTAATLGKDYSGNGNNWTPNGFLVSAGPNNDSLVDVPTSYGVDTGVGGTVRGNYATLNPLVRLGTVPLVNGNLDTQSTAPSNTTQSTIAVSSGKWYAEFAPSSSVYPRIGVQNITETNANMEGTLTISWGGSNELFVNGTITGNGGNNYTGGDIVGVAIDADTRKIWFSKNGAWVNFSGSGADPVTGTNPVGTLAGTNSIVYALRSESCTITSNFGQRPFAYTAPSGFKALCTQNLPTPTIGATTATQANQYFAPTIYTGNGANNRTITTGLQSDFVWIKNRSNVAPHLLFDVIRGAGKTLYSNLTNAEVNNGTSYVQQFNSNNFLLGVVDGAVNGNGENYVSWVWKANGTGSTNTSGSITSTVSANTTSGFSVVTLTYSGAGTVGHGLGVAPQMIIVKRRDSTGNWFIAHTGLTNMSGYYILLDSTGAQGAANWGGSPTSTTFNMSNNLFSSGTYVAYCFAPIAGYSAFGSYTGNGSTDGTFVYLGFRPAYIMIKSTDANGWIVMDSKRNTYNIANTILQPNTSGADSTDSTNYAVDFLSNGFKLRNSASYFNGSGVTLIYAAFAESPFKTSLAR